VGEFAGQLGDGGKAAEFAAGGPVQVHHADAGKNPDDPSRDDKAHGGRSLKCANDDSRPEIFCRHFVGG
jgi:hypothetical protein